MAMDMTWEKFCQVFIYTYVDRPHAYTEICQIKQEEKESNFKYLERFFYLHSRTKYYEPKEKGTGGAGKEEDERKLLVYTKITYRPMKTRGRG